MPAIRPPGPAAPGARRFFVGLRVGRRPFVDDHPLECSSIKTDFSATEFTESTETHGRG